MRYIESLVIHHSAICDEKPQAKRVHNAHLLKWSRTGYGYFEERDGTEVQLANDDQITYHCGQWNAISIGICLAGDFRYQKPTKAQLNSLARRVALLQMKYGIPDQRIFLHRELRPTSCPIVDLRKMILDMRKPKDTNEARQRRKKRKMERLKKWILKSTGRVKEMYLRQYTRLRQR